MAAIGSSIDMAERVAPDPDTKAGAGSRLMVSDIGDALPPDSTRIFEPFVTEKGAEPGAGHLGLGLFVARAIAINHGGSLRAEPLCDPVGARFIVELPLLASPAGA